MRRRLTASAASSDANVDEKRNEILYWWLMLALFFEYARPASFVPALGAAKLNSLIPISLFVIVLLVSGMRSFKEIFSDRQTQWLLTFFVLLFVQVQVADVTLRAYLIFEAALGYVFLFMIITRVVTSVRRLRGVFAALVAAHLFLIYMSPDIVLSTDQRPYILGATFLGDGNDFALSMCALLPMVAFLALGSRSKIARLTWWGVILLCLLAVVGTQSRGGTLGVLVVAGFLWSFSRRKAAALAIFVVLGGIAAMSASSTYFTRMSTIANYEGEGSAEGRIMVWKAAARMALDHPVFGVGSGQFAVAFGARYKPAWYEGPQLNAHSMYFQALGELSFLGAIVYVALVIGGIARVLSTRRRLLRSSSDPPHVSTQTLNQMLMLVAASGIGFGVAGAFLSAAYYPHIFVLSGVMVSACAIARDGMSRQATAAATGPDERSGPKGMRAARAVPARRDRASGRRTPPGNARPPRAR
jgi:probable O-glycosylation ligase (exosortase A-associated)